MVKLTKAQQRLRLAAIMGAVTTRTRPNTVSTEYLLGDMDVATELIRLISLGVLVYDWDHTGHRPRFLPGPNTWEGSE